MHSTARPLPFGLCRLHTKDGRNRVDWEIHIKAEVSSPQTVGGSGGEKQRSYPSTRICHLTKSIRWPYHNTHPHMQQHADARTPRRVGAATSVFVICFTLWCTPVAAQPDAMPTAIPIRYVTAVIAATDAMPSSMPSPLVPLFPMRRRAQTCITNLRKGWTFHPGRDKIG